MHRRLTCRSPGAREHRRQPLLQYRKFLPLITSPFQRSIRSHSVPYQDQNRCQCFATCSSTRKITSHYTSIWNIAVTNMVKYSSWKHLVCLHNIWAVSYSMPLCLKKLMSTVVVIISVTIAPAWFSPVWYIATYSACCMHVHDMHVYSHCKHTFIL